jgi:hypothetical protein
MSQQTIPEPARRCQCRDELARTDFGVSPSILVVPWLRPPTPAVPHKGGGSQTQAIPHVFSAPLPLAGEG